MGWNSALSVHHNKICAAIDSEWNFWQSYKYCMQFGMACKMWVQFSGACVNMIFKLREDEKWECWKNCWMQAAAACKLTASALTPNFQLKKKNVNSVLDTVLESKTSLRRHFSIGALPQQFSTMWILGFYHRTVEQPKLERTSEDPCGPPFCPAPWGYLAPQHVNVCSVGFFGWVSLILEKVL